MPGHSIEDVAEMVYTIAKSSFITGSIINVEDGKGAGHNVNWYENAIIKRFYALQPTEKSTKFNKNGNYSTR